MAKGTSFGPVHSNRGLDLIQQSCEVQPAPPKVNLVEIPGADGSVDLTEALGTGVHYGDREITWVFALYPGEDWRQKQAEVSNILNGWRCKIVLDDDPGYYYNGRVTVSDHKTDKLLRQITVKAICKPYKYKTTQTTITKSDLTANFKNIDLQNEKMPAVPTVTVTEDVIIRYDSRDYAVSAGTHTLPELTLPDGEGASIRWRVKLATAETGSITVKYQEGSL